MSGPNWARLVQQGRVKAMGVQWNPEEEHAIFQLRIPAEFVRRGSLTLEAYTELKKADDAAFKKTGEKPLDALTLGELQAKARELGIEATNAAPEIVLRELIKRVGEKVVEKKPKKK